MLGSDFILPSIFERNSVRFRRIIGEIMKLKKGSKIYISGRITDYDGYEALFECAEERIRNLGYVPINPVKVGKIIKVEKWEKEKSLPTYKEYIDADIEALKDCDGIAALSGWIESNGAQLEMHYADVTGLPKCSVLDLEEAEEE